MSTISKYPITFDIDRILCCTKAKRLENTLFFKREGKILFVNLTPTALKTHYIFPAVIELFTLLCQQEDVKISFFSAGLEIRNRPFVKQLLTEVLGTSGYEKIEHKIDIFSREDLSSSGQKDLSKVQLKQAILIDDTMTNIPKDQEDRFLYVPPTNADRFDRVDGKCDYYDPSTGEKWITIDFVSSKLKMWRSKEATQGSSITVIEKDTSYEVGFVDKETHRYSEHQIPEEGNEELLKALQEHSEKNTHSTQYPNWILQKIRSFVEAHGGRTSKIWRAANRVYYIAGCLVKALEHAREHKVSLFVSISQLYSGVTYEDGELPDRKWTSLSKHDALYHLGLQMLRQINPNLKFTTPHSFRDCIDDFSRDDVDEMQQALALERVYSAST